MAVDLRVQLGPLRLNNPVLVAAGTFGYGEEFESFVDLAVLGGVIVKTLTLAARPGNPAPRLVETPSGMLNAVGLQNVGIDGFLKDKWPRLKSCKAPIILSLAGFTQDEFVQLAQKAESLDVAALELNLSCPNVAHGPAARCFAQSQAETAGVVAAVRKITQKPIFAKLSAEVADLPAVARGAREAGADVLSLINTIPGMVIDLETERPVLANKTGGLSGPAIRPIALRCVWEVHRDVAAPILGSGGIVSGRDALEFILAGAAAVAVGTANFWNPAASSVVLKELVAEAEKKGTALQTLIGRAHGE